MILWRISRHRDLSGAGGLKVPGRWHYAGQPIVYLAGSPSAALLEVCVHTSANDVPPEFTLLKIAGPDPEDRKSTRLNSSHLVISYAVFCLKKKKNTHNNSYFRGDIRSRCEQVERPTPPVVVIVDCASHSYDSVSLCLILLFFFFFFNDTATTEIYTLSLHDALPIWCGCGWKTGVCAIESFSGM